MTNASDQEASTF